MLSNAQYSCWKQNHQSSIVVKFQAIENQREDLKHFERKEKGKKKKKKKVTTSFSHNSESDEWMLSNSEGKMFSNSEFYTQPANQLSTNEEQRHFQVFTVCVPFSRKLPAGGGLVAKSCPTLATPMDCSPPGSSVNGILQARILEWVATSFTRASSQPRNRTQVSCITGR